MFLLPSKGVEGKVLTKDFLKKKIEELSLMNEKEFQIFKQKNQHLDTVLPRLVFANYLFKNTKYQKIKISERELYAGIITESYNKRLIK